MLQISFLTKLIRLALAVMSGGFIITSFLPPSIVVAESLVIAAVTK